MSPPGYVFGSGETENDTPLAPARQGRPRRHGAGRGIKVRQSWTFMGNLMRRSAERLSCLFCRRQNAAGNCARRAQKRHAFGVPFHLIKFAEQIYEPVGLYPQKYSMRATGDMRLGFHTSVGRKFPNGNFLPTCVLRSQNTSCRQNRWFCDRYKSPLRSLPEDFFMFTCRLQYGYGSALFSA